MNRYHLLASLVLAASAFACGGATRSLSGIDGLSPKSAMLPADDELDAWLQTDPVSDADALLRSFALQAAGRHDEGLRAVASRESDDPWLDVALALRTTQFRHFAPTYDELSGHAATGSHSVSRAIRAANEALLAYRDYRYSMTPGLFDGASLGVPSTWRSIGPIDTLASLRFGDPTPFDDQARLPGVYTRAVGDLVPVLSLVRAGGVRLPIATSGRYVGETFFETRGEGTVLLEVDGGWEVEVMVDGTTVHQRGPADVYSAQSRWIWLAPSAGVHRIRVVAGADAELRQMRFNLTPLDGVEIACFDADCTGELTRSRMIRSGDLVELMTGDGFADDLSWLVAADVAAAAGSPALAYRLIEALPADAGAVILFHAAELTDLLHQVGPTQRSDLSRTFLEESMSRWGGAAAARVRVARLLVDQELYDEAEEILRELVTSRPDDFHVRSARASLFEARGWLARRRLELERAAVAFPRHCPIISDLISDRAMQGEPIDLESLPASFFRCDEAQRVLLERTLLPGGRLAEATEIARTLLSRDPSSRTTVWLAADVFAAAGDHDAAGAAWAEYHRWTYPDGAASIWEADLALADRELETVGRRLAGLRDAFPADLDDRLTEAFHYDATLLADIRRDAADAIAAYIADEPEYEAGSVFVLDYGALRLFEDGSGVELVHQVVEIRNRDTLGDFGEVGIPPHATLLTAAVHKRDGRVLVPDDIAGKDSISMPNLEVGDFIEIEWVEQVYSPWSDRAAYRSGRFFFQSFDSVFHESVARYYFPAAFEDAILLDARNLEAAPVLTRSGDELLYEVSVRGSEPADSDGMSIHSAEWLPSIRAAYDFDLADAVIRYDDALIDVVAGSESLDAGVQGLIADASTDEERLRRIYRYVSDNVTDFGSFMSTPATWTWEAGEGEALPLLVAMLKAAGYEPEVLFVRPWDQDWVRSDIGDASVYDLTAVRVPTSGGEYWLEPDFERYPFNYLRIDAQGCEAVVVTGPQAGSLVTTPTWPEEVERNRIRVDVELTESGDASVTIVESVPLRVAQGFRLYVQSVDDLRDVERQLEGALSLTFPGVADVALRLEGLDDADRTLDVYYEFTSAGFARRDGSQLIFDGEFFARAVANWYADRARRDHPLLISLPVLEELRVLLHAPDGWGFVEHPEDVGQELGVSRWARTFTVTGGTLEIGRDISLPVQRVEVDDYPVFAEFLRALQAGERIRVVLEEGE